jgi:hypothetical protein
VQAAQMGYGQGGMVAVFGGQGGASGQDQGQGKQGEPIR